MTPPPSVAGHESRAARWTFCACPGPPIEAVAYLFIAAHLALDPIEAQLLLDMVLSQATPDQQLAELEQILRTTAVQTRQRLSAHHPNAFADYQGDEMWWIYDAMTAPAHLGQVSQANLSCIDAGRPPRTTSRSDHLSVLHAEAAIIASLYEAVCQDTTDARAHLRAEAQRLITAGHQDQAPD
jgi:hypothetical protein